MSTSEDCNCDQALKLKETLAKVQKGLQIISTLSFTDVMDYAELQKKTHLPLNSDGTMKAMAKDLLVIIEEADKYQECTKNEY